MKVNYKQKQKKCLHKFEDLSISRRYPNFVLCTNCLKCFDLNKLIEKYTHSKELMPEDKT